MPVAFNLAEKLIRSRLATGSLMPEQEIAVSIDQTLLQDVPGTLVMLDSRRLASSGANAA
jgi:hypothetical protein